MFVTFVSSLGEVNQRIDVKKIRHSSHRCQVPRNDWALRTHRKIKLFIGFRYMESQYQCLSWLSPKYLRYHKPKVLRKGHSEMRDALEC